jgi:lipid II:glycine glycyltransferase (peptidoglycan interpeptide bridge formation enzyme)
MQSEYPQNNWNHLISSLPNVHLLQTEQWARIKTKVGWRAAHKIWGDPENPDAAAQILHRTVKLTPLGPIFRIMYIPKGPMLRDWADETIRTRVLDDLIDLARQAGVIFLKIDPDVYLGFAIPGTEGEVTDGIGLQVVADLSERGFQYAKEQVQFPNTVMIDLSSSLEELLSAMKQKTRYNIRLAGRKGVHVRKGNQADLTMLYEMYVETSLRDGFTIRNQAYYLDVWKTFMAQKEPACQPLIAEVGGEPVAAVMIFHFSTTAYYMHGMSRSVHRNKMPNYLLQWEAIKHAKNVGCIRYDLWGAPTVFDQTDPMWGVFRFKQGLGGQVYRSIGAYDLSIRPIAYKLYTAVLPRILERMRQRGRSQTEAEM